MPDDTPFTLVEKSARGLVISAANAVAIGAGVRVGAALADVRAQIPSLAVKPAQSDRDAASLKRLALWLGRYGPNRNTDGTNGTWIDVTGVPHLFGGERSLARDLADRLSHLGISARIGLADTHVAAHALARYATTSRNPVSISPEGETRRSLTRLPVDALGLEAETIKLLRRLGLKDIGQLYGLPRTALALRFRQAGAAKPAKHGEAAATDVLLRLDKALSVIADIRRPIEDPPEAVVRMSFQEPLISSAGIETATDKLARMLSENLAARDLGACRYRLVLYRTDGTVADVVIGTSSPCREASHLTRLLLDKLNSADAGFGIDLMELLADHLQVLSSRQGVLEGGGSPRMSPSELIDKLANRLGPQAFRLVLNASHIPERAQIQAPLLIAEHASPAKSQIPPTFMERPAFLLDRPEPIDVIAEIPHGAPVRVRWRRVERHIKYARGPERIAPEWWRALAREASDRPHTRDYYQLEDDAGLRYWCFREGLYDREDESGKVSWFMHGLFA